MARDGVYLYGYYGQGNLGDDLLLASALRMIRAIRPSADVFVHCHDPQRLPRLGDERIVPVAASARLADRSLTRAARLLAYRSDLSGAFKRCDAFVFGGGTVFQETGSPISLMIIAATVAMARRRGLTVAAIGAGVGRIESWAGRASMRAVLARASLFCPRDEASEAACRALSPGAALRRTGDLVYALEAQQRQGQAAPNRGRRGLALSLQPSVTMGSGPAASGARAAQRALVEAHVMRAEPCLLLAFETKLAGADGRDDRDAWRAIVGDILAAHPGLVELRTPGSAAEAAAIMGSVRLHAGMRYHGHVLAALAGAPFLGLAHDPKVEAVCRSFAMPCFDVARAEPAAVLAAADSASERRIDAAALAGLRAESALNLDALREALTRS